MLPITNHSDFEFHQRRFNATSSRRTMLRWWGECECVILRVRRQQVCFKLSGITCLACMDMVAHREHIGIITSQSQAELQHTIGAYYENIQNQIYNINFSRCQETTEKLIKMMWTMRRRWKRRWRWGRRKIKSSPNVYVMKMMSSSSSSLLRCRSAKTLRWWR